MALSPKIRALHLVACPPRDAAKVQPIAIVPKLVEPDFAASPNQYRVDGFGKSLGRKGPSPVNRSLRPVLSLALLCDAMQVPKDKDKRRE
jgi:hypothetical protein